MTPFFNTPEKIAALAASVESWRGTPFMPNACIKGAGVSCQKLVGAIYIEAGVWPADKIIPEGAMDWANAHTDSLIGEFMAREKKFMPVLAPAVGDMIGIEIGGCIHHCGIVISDTGRFIHSMRGPGVLFSNARDASYLKRIKKIWRPLL